MSWLFVEFGGRRIVELPAAFIILFFNTLLRVTLQLSSSLTSSISGHFSECFKIALNSWACLPAWEESWSDNSRRHVLSLVGDSEIADWASMWSATWNGLQLSVQMVNDFRSSRSCGIEDCNLEEFIRKDFQSRCYRDRDIKLSYLFDAERSILLVWPSTSRVVLLIWWKTHLTTVRRSFT